MPDFEDDASLLAGGDPAAEDGTAAAAAGCIAKAVPGAPPWVGNILLNELCERFSYYALRAILVLFCKERLGWSKGASISAFMFSSSLAYFMPLLGGYVADARLGKYKTILYFSGVYVCGGLALSLSAAQASTAGTVFALGLIGVGTGGIKPNVSSFGADQFKAADAAAVDRYFHVFYFCINVGSVVSFVVSPLLRQHFGYAVAFAVPAVLLAVATFVFWSARHKYTVHQPQGSPAVEFFTVFGAALRAPRQRGKLRHWMERARGSPGCGGREVADAIALWRLAQVLAVLPIFWMLFDQQGSAWTLQAEAMNLHGLQPEQMGVVNPVLVLAFIPVFDRRLYPAWNASPLGQRYPATALRRMGVGMLVAALAFVWSAFVQSVMDRSPSGGADVSVFLQLPQIVLITVAEILVSITGLEFSYEQAPQSMKSTLSSLYLLTTAVGDLLGGVMFSTVYPAVGAANLFLICAALMVANTFVFAAVADRYVPLHGPAPAKTTAQIEFAGELASSGGFSDDEGDDSEDEIEGV